MSIYSEAKFDIVRIQAFLAYAKEFSAMAKEAFGKALDDISSVLFELAEVGKAIKVQIYASEKTRQALEADIAKTEMYYNELCRVTALLENAAERAARELSEAKASLRLCREPYTETVEYEEDGQKKVREIFHDPDRARRERALAEIALLDKRIKDLEYKISHNRAIAAKTREYLRKIGEYKDKLIKRLDSMHGAAALVSEHISTFKHVLDKVGEASATVMELITRLITRMSFAESNAASYIAMISGDGNRKGEAVPSRLFSEASHLQIVVQSLRSKNKAFIRKYEEIAGWKDAQRTLSDSVVYGAYNNVFEAIDRLDEQAQSIKSAAEYLEKYLNSVEANGGI